MTPPAMKVGSLGVGRGGLHRGRPTLLASVFTLALAAAGYGQATNQTAFRTVGNTNWTVPAHVTRVDVLVVGGGGGGGG